MTDLETVSVLFTDVVGSTALASRVGAERAEAALAEHFALLREAIAATGGREVKDLGDGLMAAFPSAVAAVRCAVQMQQLLERRNRRAEDPILVRVGVSLGDALRKEGDYGGEPVVQAARLCARADGGKILCTELVRLMVGAREELSFSPVGELELKGLRAPVNTVEVVWRPLEVDHDALELPPALRTLADTEFVGRDLECQLLDASWRAALAGEPRVALLSGEPGIGKTRLAGHIALAAHRAGAVVLHGRCEEDVGIPYGPWVDALSHYARVGPLGVLDDHIKRHGGELARVVNALALRIPDLPVAPEYDQEAARFSFFAAVADLLEAAGAEHPIVILLDDLHWADRESLILLHHLVLDQSPRRRLVIGTFRDSDITDRHPLSRLLADLRRVGGVERISLSGLDETEVVALMQAAAGHDLDAEGLALAGEVRRETDGNPFFAGEVLRHLVEQGALAQDPGGRWRVTGRIAAVGIPQSVREVVGQRVHRLGGETTRTLSAASVIGPSFELELLAHVLDTAEQDVLEILEQAVAASVLRESGQVPGQFTFAHALIEHTLYEGLSATRRARLHAQVAEALEELHGDDITEHLSELAHHYGAALKPSAPTKAIEYAGRAGRRALEQLAPDEARRWFERGLELLEQARVSDQAMRCEMMIGLGEAQRQSGVPDFRRTLLDAAALAQRLGDGQRIARAVLATSRGLGSVSQPDHELIGLLQAASESLPDSDPRRARVVALLASELTFTTDVPTRRALVEEALALARRAGDPHTLAFVLIYYMFALWFPETLSERLGPSAEMVKAAQSAADPPLLFHAAARRWSTVMEAGDLDAGEECLAQMRAVIDATPQPILRWRWLYHSCARELLAGRAGEAEVLAEESLRVGALAGEADAQAFHAALLSFIRWEQGRLGESEALIAAAITQYPGFNLFRPLHALALCGSGREPEGAAMLAQQASEKFAAIPSNALWTTSMLCWSHVASRVGDRDAARTLYGRLEPFADLVAVSAIGIPGATAHALGLTAPADRPAQVDEHFASALAMHERLKAPLLVARVRTDWARRLRARGTPQDMHRADKLLAPLVASGRDG
jgi:class 3 adenylate cyclase